jgi:hypothetical protein
MAYNFDGVPKPPGYYHFCAHGKLAWRQANETNSAGHIGVSSLPNEKFGSKIFDPEEGRTVWLGTFDTPEEAGNAFLNAHECIHGPAPKHLQPVYLPCLPIENR